MYADADAGHLSEIVLVRASSAGEDLMATFSRHAPRGGMFPITTRRAMLGSVASEATSANGFPRFP